MVHRIFVDTDVVIDYLTDRHPFAEASTLLFELHAQRRIELYMSALSVNNIYYISRRLIGEEKTLRLIDTLIDAIEIVGTTKKEIRNAFKTGFKDFEDSIQYCTAETIKEIEAIITRNVKDYRKSKIAVFTPEVYIRTQVGCE